MSKKDVAERERHLKEMRDRIVNAKRLGREEEASKVEAAELKTPAGVAGARKIRNRTGRYVNPVPFELLLLFSRSTLLATLGDSFVNRHRFLSLYE